MDIKAIVLDGKSMNERVNTFLRESGFLDEDDGFFWLTKMEILDSFEEQLTDVPDGWWADAGFTREQRRFVEDLWRRYPGAEIRWEAYEK